MNNLNNQTPSYNQQNKPDLSEYYFCYSLKLQSIIKQNNIPYIVKAVNPSTNRTFWLYKVTDQLSTILTKWTNTNPYKQI